MSQIYFLGLLNNTNENLEKLVLKHNFKMKNISYRELEDILLNILELNEGQYATAYDMLYMFFREYERDDYVIITNELDEKDIKIFDKDLVQGYLFNTLRLMRLFKEGNPDVVWYCYHDSKGVDDEGFAIGHSDLNVSFDKSYFNVSMDEIEVLQDFLDTISTPFSLGYLQLAYETFQESYEVNNSNLSFLLNMIGIEVLLNPGGTELTYKVSRNTAILLGKDRDHANEVFNNMRHLYRIRSNLVHGNRRVRVELSDLLLLRNYLRESIKEINVLNLKKEELFKILNIYGFGERPWVK